MLHHRANLVRVAEIRANRDHFTPCAGNFFLYCLCAGLIVVIGDRHVGSQLGQELRGRCANAGRRTGNERNLAC